MCEVSSSYEFGKSAFVSGQGMLRRRRRSMKKKKKKRTKMRGVPGCWPENLNIRVSVSHNQVLMFSLYGLIFCQLICPNRKF